MSHIVLVTGGCRSGKSRFALALAESLPGPRLYVATCPVLDDEMRQRVARHQEERAGRGWETLEETTDLAEVIAPSSHRVILIDCLTLWINNLLYRAEQQGRLMEEKEISAACERVLDVSLLGDRTLVFVTNEVGSGIVPENPLARKFRDLEGRCNQLMAAKANEVVLVVCGIPMWVKGKNHGKPVA